MPLTSPRFRNERDLIAIEANRAVMQRGSHGRHVHLVQMALIDLGFGMPVSTSSNDYSPDGVYGIETETVVKAFQRSVPPPGLTPDGAVGQLTMRELDKRFPTFTHRFNLHFRSLALSNVPFDRLMSGTAQVYAQYGIEARFANGQSLGLSLDEEARFSVVKQNCDWVMDSGEFADLHRLGTPIPNNDVAVFIVNQFQENIRGCGGHATNLPACAVSHDCLRWSLAHEICHVLLTSSFAPQHTDSTRNLMFHSESLALEPPALTEKQTAKIRSSPLCRTT
jgi:hypothetical protein